MLDERKEQGSELRVPRVRSADARPDHAKIQPQRRALLFKQYSP
jgi:hypothetical protein